jgi:hypothetical protein
MDVLDQNQPVMDPDQSEREITEPPVPVQSKVVVPASANHLPKWFYFLFIVVVIAFVSTTFLLVTALTK